MSVRLLLGLAMALLLCTARRQGGRQQNRCTSNVRTRAGSSPHPGRTCGPGGDFHSDRAAGAQPERASDPGVERETLQFLFDKRLALFNTRRDHEWRVAFGAMVLVGAVDAGLLTQELHLSWTGIGIWWAALALLFLAVTAYQFGVQTRNRVDRIAMDAIYSRLCDLEGFVTDSPIRVGVDRANPAIGTIPTGIVRLTYLWAFLCQSIVLLAACVLSGALPLVINGAFLQAR